MSSREYAAFPAALCTVQSAGAGALLSAISESTASYTDTDCTTLLCFRRMSKGDPHNKVAFVQEQQSSYRGMHSLSLAPCCTGLQYLAHRVSVFNAEGALLSRVGGVPGPGPDLGQLSLPSSVWIVGREAYIAVAESINARGESVLSLSLSGCQ